MNTLAAVGVGPDRIMIPSELQPMLVPLPATWMLVIRATRVASPAAEHETNSKESDPPVIPPFPETVKAPFLYVKAFIGSSVPTGPPVQQYGAVTTAVPNFVVSAALVAVTITLSMPEAVVGAV